MKPYQKIAIQECGEPLVAIEPHSFVLEDPSPYAKLGADYGDKSPYFLRETVYNKLIIAREKLQQTHPNWQIKVFDAYRPVAVQQFMVDYTFNSLLQENNLQETDLTPAELDGIWARVYKMWAVPSLDATTPPPHSTGGAVDLTLVDAEGNTVDMGGEIDELSDRSHPDYYSNSRDDRGLEYRSYRELLYNILISVDFRRHPNEWWHFSYGDQLWAWLKNQEDPILGCIAKYGGISLDRKTLSP
jgi:zinc D-Ala-D-Ala dipeptidase